MMEKKTSHSKPEAWDKFYTSGDGVVLFPSEQVIRLLAKDFKVGRSFDLKILDLGCGNGRNLPVIRHFFDPNQNQAYAIDISKEAISKVKKAYGDSIEASVMNFEDTGFQANFFDVIIDDGSTHHASSPDKAFKESDLKEVGGNGLFESESEMK